MTTPMREMALDVLSRYLAATPGEDLSSEDILALLERTGVVQVQAVPLPEPPTHLRVAVELMRLGGRAKCPACGRRRVLFALAASTPETLVTIARGRCADCSGMRS